MDGSLEKRVNGILVGLICAGAMSAPAYGQNGEIFIIEAGADPTAFGGGPTVLDVTGRLGEEIEFEIYVRAIATLEPLRAVAVDFPCSLGLAEYVPGSGHIDTANDTYIFLDQSHENGVKESSCPDGTVRFAMVLNSGVIDINDGLARYAGQFKLRVSASADCGTSVVLSMIGGSRLGNVDSVTIPAFLRNLIIVAESCPVPTSSEWGIVIVVMLVLAVGALEISRRRPGAGATSRR